MTLHRRFFRKALAAVSVLALGVLNAQAAPTLIVQSGVLVGADNVRVGNATYDVRFVDGSCAGLYDGCNSLADFVFDTKKEANAATAALLREVLVDGPDGRFDSDPSQVAGCDAIRCAILTPYRNDRNRVNLASAMNTASRDRTSGGRVLVTRDTTQNERSVFAVWSLHDAGETTDPVTPSVVRFVAPQLEVLAPPTLDANNPNAPGTVPEPGLLALLALGVPLLGWSRRRGRAVSQTA